MAVSFLSPESRPSQLLIPFTAKWRRNNLAEENVDWFDWLHFLFDHSNKVRLLPVSHENPASRSILIAAVDLI